MGIGTFAITWSFFFSTPGVVKWSLSTDPIAWNLTGEFLYKDVVLLCVCIVLFLTSLPKNVVPLRSALCLKPDELTGSAAEGESATPRSAGSSSANGGYIAGYTYCRVHLVSDSRRTDVQSNTQA